MAKKLKTAHVTADNTGGRSTPSESAVRFMPSWLVQKKQFQKAGIWDRLEKKLIHWLTMKVAHPTQMVGKDSPFSTSSNLNHLYHAHLTRDESIVYTYDKTSNTLFLFGVYTHAELGTGEPHNYYKQKSIAATVAAQLDLIKSNQKQSLDNKIKQE